MIGFIAVQDDNAALIAAMADPAIRIVSLTVTEGGYYIDPATGSFDPNAADIVADAAQPPHPHRLWRHHRGPEAAPRCRHRALYRDVLRQPARQRPCHQAAVVGLARLSDPAFADWIAANVAFPNGMVDRITPATGPRERAMAADFGLADDPVPVTCEPFRQWVLEDNFPAGRPALEKVGVTFTPHVHAYETMKIRILNGGHAIIAYPGGLMDIEYVHEAMADPLIRAFLDKVETRRDHAHRAPGARYRT